jgi:3-hydroxyacyl-[acyl-carrier-protein] dehydratase
LFDRIQEAERGKFMRATKLVNLMDEYFSDHFPLQAVMPSTLIVEAIAQLGGFLNSLNHDFTVEMVLMLIDGVHIHQQIRQGDLLHLEVQMLYDHPYGATLQGKAYLEDQVVVSVERMAFAHEFTDDPSIIERNKARFAYQSGGFLINEE